MMKILFPATNRVHLSRQKLLLCELSNYVDVKVVESPEYKSNDMAQRASQYSIWFLSELREHKPDAVLIRGDRFEMLPLAMLAVYSGIKVIHLEGGDETGVVDNKVRHAITRLADIHFATNKESYARLIKMGTDPKMTFDFGSLDVEYANSLVLDTSDRTPYIVVSFHPFPEEDGQVVRETVERFENKGYQIINITSNKDYGLIYKGEEYEPEEYMSLLKYASCLVGNSSSFLKEASIFGTPVVDVGTRQKNRLKLKNVLSVRYERQSIRNAIDRQLLKRRFVPAYAYFKENTSLNITNKIIELCEF